MNVSDRQRQFVGIAHTSLPRYGSARVGHILGATQIMKHSRSLFVRLLALLLLATLLFARLAAAGYLCPRDAGAAMEPVAMATMKNCLEMDYTQPALCADHQQDGRHWADNNTHSPDPGILPVAVKVLRMLQPTPYAIETHHVADSANTSPGAIYLATARLRL